MEGSEQEEWKHKAERGVFLWKFEGRPFETRGVVPRTGSRDSVINPGGVDMCIQ